MSSSNYFRSWIDRPHLDPNTRLLTEEYQRGLDHRKVHRNIPRKFSLGIFRGAFRRTGGPRSFLGNSFPRNSIRNFRGISEEKYISEELFPRTYFVGYLIPKGWKLLTWFRNVHMDPEVYLDPRKFDPSRWDKGFIPKAGAFLLVLEAIYAKKYDLPGSRKVDFDRFILLSKWKRMVLSVVSQYRDDFNFGYDLLKKNDLPELGTQSFSPFPPQISGETEQHQVSTDVLACLIPDRLIIARK
ncbi:hypothetical protein F2Q69_00024223 [Brassica cretica]|uniref:Uncharacterized protein n=1 Tax=Brassica cretica TaxID=69181 RepID=A0A8S9PUG5_BRACR|nr:hypothetical protein F2Q69_00024223 [Brassica cretica]